MKLKTKFFMLMVVILMGFAAVAWLFSQHLMSRINEQWAAQLAERQVQFDKHRTLLPLTREIALARQMAAEPALIDMALNESDPEVARRAIEVMERYRLNFRDHSYFAAFARTGHYYFNDTASQFASSHLRYTLSRTKSNDKWFFATMSGVKDYQVNLDPDANLGVTKVWINVLIKRGAEVLGVIGTGIDITEFLKETVDIAQPGIHNLFVDRDMAIQLYRDAKLIDYASITKDVKQRSKVDILLKDAADIENLRQVMNRLETSGEKIATLWVSFEGEKQLLGVAYLPELGWFDLTLMNTKKLSFSGNLALVPLLFGLFFLLALMAVGVVLHHWVLNPISRLQNSMGEIRQGNYDTNPPLVGTGEIYQLSLQFRSMVEFVRDSNRVLEEKIRQRTEELHRLAESDPMTGLLNRRGMIERFDMELSRLARQSGGLGLLLMDLDHFKSINDKYGHAVGDEALRKAAEIIGVSGRPYDHAARWGGEEFLVLLPECDEDGLLATAERIRKNVEALSIAVGDETVKFTVSVGAYFASKAEDQDRMLNKVDQALYRAKDAGRNCTRCF